MLTGRAMNTKASTDRRARARTLRARVACHLSHHLVGYAALCAALLVGAGVARSAVPGADKVIHACYDTADGTLHVVDREAGAGCSRTQTALSWNQAGPAGPPGPRGASGTLGRAGTQLFAKIDSGSSPLARSFAKKTKKPSRRLARRLAATPSTAGEARSTFKDGAVALPNIFSTTGPKTVATLALPAGRWVIHAKTNAGSSS